MTESAKINVAIIGDLAIGENITPSGSKTSPGGAAYYSMIGAVNFSPNIGIVAKIGDDFERKILEDRGVDARGVKQISGKSCRFIAIQHEDNTREVIAERGVAETVDPKIMPRDYLSAQFIHLATQLPEHALIWLEYLRGHPAISVDTFEDFVELYPEESKKMLDLAGMIFINLTEYKALGLTEHSYPHKPVVLKLGKDGVIYRSPKETISIPALKVTTVETSGAGDVLAGAFLTLLSLGVSTATALEKATHLASQSVTQFGVEHLLAQHNTELT